MPLFNWNSSPVRWVVLPGPAEAIVSVPLRLRASAISSFTVRTGSEGCTLSTRGTMETSDVGAKSLMGS